jgi:hypothetical protein
MKPRTLKEEVARIKGMMRLNEGGWNLPDNVSDNDPYFNQPDDDNSEEIDTWEYDPKAMEFTLHGYYGGTATLFVDALLGYDEQFDQLFPEDDEDQNITLQRINTPEAHNLITKKINEYIDKSGVDWSGRDSGSDYSGPDEYDGGGDTRWMDYINEDK